MNEINFDLFEAGDIIGFEYTKVETKKRVEHGFFRIKTYEEEVKTLQKFALLYLMKVNGVHILQHFKAQIGDQHLFLTNGDMIRYFSDFEYDSIVHVRVYDNNGTTDEKIIQEIL